MMWWTRSEQAAAEARMVEGCQLHCTPDTKTTTLYRKYGFGPCSVIFAEVDINNEAKHRF